MQVNRVAVVGAGTMGSSITVALISRAFPVILKDVDDNAVKAGLANIDRLLKSRVDKGLPAHEAESQRALVQPTTDYSTFAEVDFVIEAVPETPELKRKILQDLDEWCNVDAVFASNTSSLSITQLGAFTRRPDKVVGLHFFNPAHLMKLVEVIPGLETSADTVNTAVELGQSLGKLAVRVEECASFLVNRLLGRYINEALWVLQEGQLSVEEIDKAATEYVMPIGPLALRDMNGADVGLSVARYNFQEYGDRFVPPPILEEMVRRNLLGQKTMAGFYKYDETTRKRAGANPQLGEIISSMNGAKNDAPPFSVERLFMPMINEAFLVLQERVSTAEDLDPALMAGLGMKRGPLTLASEIGLAECLKKIEDLYRIYGERFRPAPLLKRYVWARRTSVV
ncbi:MAG TPA: 3-hydroxyacyl-CoA dehydrogenase [Planktothrix sp.]|jgi:3-hydroxyacyl-CoA dehydrogenase